MHTIITNSVSDVADDVDDDGHHGDGDGDTTCMDASTKSGTLRLLRSCYKHEGWVFFEDTHFAYWKSDDCGYTPGPFLL